MPKELETVLASVLKMNKYLHTQEEARYLHYLIVLKNHLSKLRKSGNMLWTYLKASLFLLVHFDPHLGTNSALLHSFDFF